MNKLLRAVKRRMFGNVFIDAGIWLLAAAGAGYLAGVPVSRYLSKFASPWEISLAAAVFALPVLVVYVLRRRPNDLDAARKIDRSADTHDRFIAAVFCDDRGLDDDFSRHVRAEAEQFATEIRPERCARLRISPALAVPIVVFLAGAAASHFLPSPNTPPGLSVSERTEAQELAKSLAEKKNELEVAAATDEQLAEALEELEAAAESLSKEFDRKDDLLAEMDRLSERLSSAAEKREAEAQAERNELAARLDEAGLSEEAEMLRNGDWSGALQKLSDKMKSGELTDEQKNELAKKLEELAESGSGSGEELKKAADVLRNGDSAAAARALESLGEQSPEARGGARALAEAAEDVNRSRDKIVGGESGESSSGAKIAAPEPRERREGRSGEQARAGFGSQGRGHGGIGTGSTNEESQGGQAGGDMRGLRRQQVDPLRRDEYERIYAPEWLADEGYDVVSSGTEQGPRILLDEVLTSPGEQGEGATSSPRRAPLDVYRRAGEQAMEYEEVPREYREYVREYFDEVLE